MTPKQREIYLVPIPFSDLSSQKKRPVLIISNDTYNTHQEDCLVMGITSNLVPRNPHTILLENDDLEEGFLPKKSALRGDKIYSIYQGILIRRFGKINPSTYRHVFKLLIDLIS